MSSPPLRIAVQDANVLIDLELAGLFDLWFQTGIETHTTDLIRAELERGEHLWLSHILRAARCGNTG